MEKNNAANVSTGQPRVGGAVFSAEIADVAAAGGLPTNADPGALDPAIWENLGYCSEDGATNGRDGDTSDIKAWGGDTVASTSSGETETWKVSFIEQKPAVFRELWGKDNVTVNRDNSLAIKHAFGALPKKCWVIDTMKNKKIHRTVLPNAAITSRDEVTYTDSDVVKYGVTITAYSDENGIPSYSYFEGDPQTFIPVSGITLDSGLDQMNVSSKPREDLDATVAPATATNQTIIWSVKDAGTTGALLDVNPTSGKMRLTISAAGTATVTATIADGTAVGTDFAKDFSILVSA
jgi:hypothetical protein